MVLENKNDGLVICVRQDNETVNRFFGRRSQSELQRRRVQRQQDGHAASVASAGRAVGGRAAAAPAAEPQDAVHRHRRGERRRPGTARGRPQRIHPETRARYRAAADFSFLLYHKTCLALPL